MAIRDLDRSVAEYWDANPCGAQLTTLAPLSAEYFEEIEAKRYALEPEVHAFAQFPRHHGHRVLEVGLGTGTDFIQWARVGAEAYGMDITQASISQTAARLNAYGLDSAVLAIADSQNIPFADEVFDLVYSWGVIHHVPQINRALAEIVRVTRKGGQIKLMVYHRRSLAALQLWLRECLLRLRPFHTLSWAFYNRKESLGTRAFTRSEIAKSLKGLPIRDLEIKTHMTSYDRLAWRKEKLLRFPVDAVAGVLGWDKVGYHMTVELKRDS